MKKSARLAVLAGTSAVALSLIAAPAHASTPDGGASGVGVTTSTTATVDTTGTDATLPGAQLPIENPVALPLPLPIPIALPPIDFCLMLTICPPFASAPVGTPTTTTASTTPTPTASAAAATPKTTSKAAHPSITVTPAKPTLWRFAQHGVVLHLTGLANRTVDISWGGSNSGGPWKTGVRIGASGTRDLLFRLPSAVPDRYTIGLWAADGASTATGPIAQAVVAVRTNANVTWLATHRTADGLRLRATVDRYSASADHGQGAWVQWTGAHVVFQERTATGWRTVGSDRVDTTGTAQVTVPVHGEHLFRAVVASTWSTVGDRTEHQVRG